MKGFIFWEIDIKRSVDAFDGGGRRLMPGYFMDRLRTSGDHRMAISRFLLPISDLPSDTLRLIPGDPVLREDFRLEGFLSLLPQSRSAQVLRNQGREVLA